MLKFYWWAPFETTHMIMLKQKQAFLIGPTSFLNPYRGTVFVKKIHRDPTYVKL